MTYIYLACSFHLDLSRSSTKVKVSSHDVHFSATDALYDVTYTFSITRRQHQTSAQNLTQFIGCLSSSVFCAKVIGATSSEGFLVN